MNNSIEAKDEKPEPQNGKATFSIKCYPEDALGLKNAQKIVGQGHEFGRLLYSLVESAGLCESKTIEYEEIILLKKNLSRVATDFVAQSSALLNGFQVQLRQRSTLLEEQASDIQKSRQGFEKELSDRKLQIADLTKRIDGLCQHNAALVGENEATNKLIRILEGQVSERNAHIQELQNLAEEKAQEAKTLADNVKTS
jgi:chromosome segregation ATPase